MIQFDVYLKITRQLGLNDEYMTRLLDNCLMADQAMPLAQLEVAKGFLRYFASCYLYTVWA